MVTATVAAAALFSLSAPYDWPAMTTVGLVAAGCNVIAVLSSRSPEGRGPLIWPGERDVCLNLLVSADVVVLAAALHLTGGVQSILVPGYLVLVPAARLILSRRATLLQGTLAILLLPTTAWWEHIGRVAHIFAGPVPAPQRYADAGYLTQALIFETSFICLGILVADQVSSRLRLLLLAERRARQRAEQAEALRDMAAALAVEKARLYEETRLMALTDALTGLYNRRHLSHVLEHELPRSRRHGHPLSLLLFDLDDFKKVNDRFGHLVGDDVLRQVADLTRLVVRDSDSAFRYGGEEFALILPETAGDAALALAERLRQAVDEHVFVGHAGIRLDGVTISVGVATYPKDGHGPDSLMNAADLALLRAKERKNEVCVFAVPACIPFRRPPAGAATVNVAIP